MHNAFLSNMVCSSRTWQSALHRNNRTVHMAAAAGDQPDASMLSLQPPPPRPPPPPSPRGRPQHKEATHINIGTVPSQTRESSSSVLSKPARYKGKPRDDSSLPGPYRRSDSPQPPQKWNASQNRRYSDGRPANRNNRQRYKPERSRSWPGRPGLGPRPRSPSPSAPDRGPGKGGGGLLDWIVHAQMTEAHKPAAGFRAAGVLMYGFKEENGELYVLLSVEKKSKGAIQYALPGGKRERGEEVVQTAAREVEEETHYQLPAASFSSTLAASPCTYLDFAKYCLYLVAAPLPSAWELPQAIAKHIAEKGPHKAAQKVVGAEWAPLESILRPSAGGGGVVKLASARRPTFSHFGAGVMNRMKPLLVQLREAFRNKQDLMLPQRTPGGNTVIIRPVLDPQPHTRVHLGSRSPSTSTSGDQGPDRGGQMAAASSSSSSSHGSEPAPAPALAVAQAERYHASGKSWSSHAAHDAAGLDAASATEGGGSSQQQLSELFDFMDSKNMVTTATTASNSMSSSSVGSTQKSADHDHDHEHAQRQHQHPATHSSADQQDAAAPSSSAQDQPSNQAQATQATEPQGRPEAQQQPAAPAPAYVLWTLDGQAVRGLLPKPQRTVLRAPPQKRDA